MNSSSAHRGRSPDRAADRAPSAALGILFERARDLPASGTSGNMPRRRLGRVAVIASLACLAAFANPGFAQDATVTVRIGRAEPMTGGLAAVGMDNTNAVRMAIEELNRRAMVIGGKRVLWELDAQDDQGDPRQATQVAQKFVDEKVNGVVGHANSGSTGPAAIIYARAGIPQITPASTDPSIARRGHATFFRMIADDEAQSRSLARYAADTLHLRSVVVIDDRTAYGQGQADAFARAAKDAGMRVLAREYTNDKATDFSAVLTRMRGLRPDALFYGGLYGQGGPLLRQMRRLGMEARYIGGNGSCMPAMAQTAGDAVNGALCAESGLPLHAMPDGEAWLKRYRARFGVEDVQAFAPYAYDATMVLAAAMAKAGSTEPRKYLPYLRDVGYDGVTKRDIRFTPQGNLVEPSVTIEEFQDGRQKVLTAQQVR